MTIAYDTFEAAIAAWFEGATGLKAYWRERQRGHERALAFGLLNVISVTQVGVDEVRQEFDAGAPAGEEIKQSVAGNRIITVSCQVKSRSQKALSTARYYLSKARTSLRDPAVRTTFQADDIAVVRAEPLQNLDFTEQERRVSLSNMDVLFSTVVNEAVAAATYIETVKVSSTFSPPVSPSVELDNLELP